MLCAVTLPSDHEQEFSSGSLSRLSAAAINTAGYPWQQVVEEKGDGSRGEKWQSLVEHAILRPRGQSLL